MDRKIRNPSIITHHLHNFISVEMNKIVFAFICGSVARNENDSSSDIDFFICMNTSIKNFKTKFTKWYRKTHQDLGFKPDLKFSGEIMTLSRLDANLKKALGSVPNRIISDQSLYDGIVWAGMLSSKTVGFVGNKIIFLSRKVIADEVLNKWKKGLMSEFEKTESDIFLKQVVKFKK